MYTANEGDPSTKANIMFAFGEQTTVTKMIFIVQGCGRLNYVFGMASQTIDMTVIDSASFDLIYDVTPLACYNEVDGPWQGTDFGLWRNPTTSTNPDIYVGRVVLLGNCLTHFWTQPPTWEPY